MNIKGVLFDCDGCLLDSEYIYINSLVDYLNSIGLSTTIQEMVFVLGKPNDAILQDITTKFNLDGKYTKEQLNDGINEYFDNRFDHCILKPMPHLIDLLKLLKAKNIKVAVVSSSSNAYLDEVLKRLRISDYISLVIGREFVTKGKPNPDIYLLAQEKLGLARENLMIIEDSSNGIKAGKSAGIYTVGYKGSVIKQNTSEADREISDYSELFEMFQ